MEFDWMTLRTSRLTSRERKQDVVKGFADRDLDLLLLELLMPHALDVGTKSAE